MTRRRVLTLLLLASATSASAHGRSVSYSSWELGGPRVQVEARFASLEATRLGPTSADDDTLATYVTEHLQLASEHGPCRPTAAAVVGHEEGAWLTFTWELDCPEAARREITSALFLEPAPSHLHFARVRLADGTREERVLTGAEPHWLVVIAAAAASGGSTFAEYVALGVGHIASGWDHLAFVLALLLLAETLAEVATVVTAFTLAHSITLGVAVLGLVRPDATAIEALIGFSIALVAAENAWLLGGRDSTTPWIITAALVGLGVLARTGVGALPTSVLLGLALFTRCHFGLLARAARPARLRALVAFAFGLVHGFGFAGVLATLELPTRRLVPALLGFNLGVEFGQLAVVVSVWPLLQLVGQRFGWQRALAELGSAAVCGVGVVWFLVRAYG